MLEYYKRFFMAFWKDFAKSTREHVIGAVLAVAILILQIRYGVIKQAEVKGNELAVAWPYIGLVGSLLVIHLIRAPWKLDKEHGLTHEEHSRKISETHRQLQEEIASRARPHRIEEWNCGIWYRFFAARKVGEEAGLFYREKEYKLCHVGFIHAGPEFL